MLKKADKNANRLQRHKRVRRKITGDVYKRQRKNCKL